MDIDDWVDAVHAGYHITYWSHTGLPVFKTPSNNRVINVYFRSSCNYHMSVVVKVTLLQDEDDEVSCLWTVGLFWGQHVCIEYGVNPRIQDFD